MNGNPPQPSLKILLAEDDEVNQEIVAAFFDGMPNCELTIAPDGRAALEKALSRKYDLLIFDQNMPFITGARVLLHLRASRSLNALTPAIRFTAAADAKSAEPARSSSAIVVTLPKPLRRETFVSTVKAMLDLA